MKVKEQIEVYYTEAEMKLRDWQKRISKLIDEYGPDAVLEFDGGYSNVEAIVHYERDETPKEVAAREEKERIVREKKAEKLRKQRARIEKKLKELEG